MAGITQLSLNLLTLALLIFTSFAAAEDSNPTNSIVTLRIANIDSDTGSLFIAVYDDKKHFLKDEGAVEGLVLVVADHLKEGKITTQLELPPGQYAIVVHHDDNANDEMDTNWIGIPNEPIGISNGHIPKYGPPKYEKAEFTLGDTPHEEYIELLD